MVLQLPSVTWTLQLCVGTHTCLINPQVNGLILFTQHRISLGPRAECQRSEKNSFDLPSRCPLSPEDPTRSPETGARSLLRSRVTAHMLWRHASICAPSALLSGLLGVMRPHLPRLPRQTGDSGKAENREQAPGSKQ